MNTIKRTLFTGLALPTLLAPAFAYSVVAAATTPGNTSTYYSAETASATSDSSSSSTDSQRLSNIKTKGDAEINRRLAALGTLSTKISNATKLTSADKSTLLGEVTAEISGLTALKAKLDAETTVSAAAADVQNMVTEYRVYALIVPKIQFVRMADNQQVVQSKLTALATKLQTRIQPPKPRAKTSPCSSSNLRNYSPLSVPRGSSLAALKQKSLCCSLPTTTATTARSPATTNS